MESSTPRSVFVTGASGYIGSRLVTRLARMGHSVRAVYRPTSTGRVPAGVTPYFGNALEGRTYRDAVRPNDTFVHLVGVAHPSPSNAARFESIDRVALEEAVSVAVEARVRHFVYVSVAHPAPIMESYIRVRQACEETIRASGLHATLFRPWYVLGPGHRWPYLLLPLYWIGSRIPSLKAGTTRLGLVTIEQMVSAMTFAVEHPPSGIRTWGVPQIRSFGREQAQPKSDVLRERKEVTWNQVYS